VVDRAEVERQDVCYVTTRGRRSGRPHEIEIWFAVAGDTFYLLSGGGESADWVRNLRAEPAVMVRVGDAVWSGQGRVVTDDREAGNARRLVFEKYQPRSDGSLTRWRETALPVAIELQS
jgi:deazaflavin-dependent oxidoreductase (nitroreductase family)